MSRLRLTGMLTVAFLTLGLVWAGTTAAAAAEGLTCRGGTFTSPTVIPAGTYGSVTIAGLCAPGPGTVTVENGLTVEPGGGFVALTASAIVTIKGMVKVNPGGIFAMGCGPSSIDPSTDCVDNPALTSSDSVGNKLQANDPLLLIVHHNTIVGNVLVNGTSGPMTCNNIPGLPLPPYVDLDSNVIGGNIWDMDLRTCWDGLSNNQVAKNVTFVNNLTIIGDGNFLGGNHIGGSLGCYANSPKPHLSDVTPVPNTVGGLTQGQCVGEV